MWNKHLQNSALTQDEALRRVEVCGVTLALRRLEGAGVELTAQGAELEKIILQVRRDEQGGQNVCSPGGSGGAKMLWTVISGSLEGSPQPELSWLVRLRALVGTLTPAHVRLGSVRQRAERPRVHSYSCGNMICATQYIVMW